MGERWNGMREPVSLEKYAEESDRRIRELADLPMDLAGLETAPHIPGSLHTAATGDSISSIMGSIDPAAIGAFMQANDLNGTAIRAGESYLVPERDSFTAPGARALGQQGLNADNALATQRARDRLDRSMASIDKTVRSFDPLKGLLATVPAMAGGQNASFNSGTRPTLLGALGVGAEHTGRFAQGKDAFVQGAAKFGEKVLGINDLQNFDRVSKGLGRAGGALSLAGEGLGAADDYFNKGVPLKVVVPGTAMRGGATAAGGLVGGMLLGWAGPPGWAAGGLAGSYLADRYLPSRKVLGEQFNKSMEELAERPYYYGAS